MSSATLSSATAQPWKSCSSKPEYRQHGRSHQLRYSRSCSDDCIHSTIGVPKKRLTTPCCQPNSPYFEGNVYLIYKHLLINCYCLSNKNNIYIVCMCLWCTGDGLMAKLKYCKWCKGYHRKRSAYNKCKSRHKKEKWE